VREIIRLDRVSKGYSEGTQTRPVLREASASLAEGELVAIRGRSGSGKTTLLNLIAGIDRPSAGEVWVDGTSLGRLSARDRTLFRRDRLGLVFQFFNLIGTLTALENVQLPLELQGVAGPEVRRRASARLDEVGLLERASDFPDRLSGGEQQRVAIARALVAEPRVLLADEPTGNLDDASGRMVLELLDRVSRRAGRTLVLVTHSAEAAAAADRVYTIEEGRLVGRPADEGARA
jgi:putative ABC transport system ATP-binding protein